jgi:hypothetical protein
MRFRLTAHARAELERRQIPLALLESVLYNPQQIVIAGSGRKSYQSQLDFGEGRVFLLRAIVEDDADPAVVVTVYRTSKVEKYWRRS